MTSGRQRNSLVALSFLGFAILAWGAILLVPEAVYWDDWIIVNDDTLAWARESGLPWIGYVHGALAAVGMWTFKVLAIGFSALTGWFAYLVAGRGLGLTASERWALGALVVVLPLNVTRDIAILTTYSWSLTLFLAAWWLVVRTGPAGRRLGIVLAVPAFLVSYTTASLLPFTALVIAHTALLDLPRSRPLGGIPRFLAHRWYLFVAPVGFWVLRSTVLEPWGLYADYNELGGGLVGPPLRAVIGGLVVAALAAVVLLWRAAAHVPSAPRRDAIAVLPLAGIALLGAWWMYLHRASGEAVALVVPVAVALAAVVVAIGAVVRLKTADRGAPVAPLIGIAVGAVVLGMLPYLLVGKMPSWAVWESRHQLLLPLGIAALGVAAFRTLSRLLPAIPARIGIGAVIAGFTATSAYATLGLVADAHKQEQIVAALAADDTVRYSGTVIVIDDAAALGYDARVYDFYELTGWLWQAYGDHSRLGLPISGVDALKNGEIERLLPWATRYGFGEWNPTDPRVAVVTIEAVGHPTILDLLRGEQAIRISSQSVPGLDGLP